jgi:hypothetical protein
MAVLKLVSSVKLREFMNALRGKPFPPKIMGELEEYVERQPTLASLGTVPPWKPIFERSGNTASAVFERQIVAARLRMYVDEWIDTGVTARGEVPLQRDLVRAPGATKVLRDYMDQNRPRPSPQKSLEFVFEMCDPAIADGSMASARRFDLVCRAFEETARLFAGLMLSEWGQRLCRCRYSACGRYFLKHAYRRAPLVHGTFCCPGHQRKASASDCVRKSRSNQTRKLIEAAAAILVRWRIVNPQWQEDANRKLKLANALSATPLCRRHKLLLRPNWVTRHHHSIEKRRLELAATD